jgi:Zn ribbon nucleic-acid-binding protein
MTKVPAAAAVRPCRWRKRRSKIARMSSVSAIQPPRADIIMVVATCPDCKRRGTLQLVRHPAADMLVCRRCLGAHRQKAAVSVVGDEVRTSQGQRLADRPS